jgi:hypothetical protein
MKQKEKCEELTGAHFLGLLFSASVLCDCYRNRSHGSALFVQCTQYRSYMTQAAEWVLLALFVGICQQQSSRGKGKRGDCLAITSFHCSKDTRP